MDEVCTADITLLSRLKNLIWFHIEEAPTHGAVSGNAFQVSASATSAVILFGVERDNHVAALPWPFCRRMATEADAVANGPDMDQSIQVTTLSGNPGSDGVCVVED